MTEQLKSDRTATHGSRSPYWTGPHRLGYNGMLPADPILWAELTSHPLCHSHHFEGRQVELLAMEGRQGYALFPQTVR